MKITHIENTVVPVWIKNGNGRKVLRWVSPGESERIWHEQQMIKLYGRGWNDTQD